MAKGRSNPQTGENRPENQYFVPILGNALDILDAFRSPGQELTLKEVIERTGVPHASAFRILYTFVQRGYVGRRGKRYRLIPLRGKLKVGFAALGERVAVSRQIAESLRRATAEFGVDLVTVDNRLSPQLAIENARRLVEQRVNVAIEFQNDVETAPIIADIFGAARIPTIAIHIPHPGAVYFGPDNYRAGCTAGNALGQFSLQRWDGQFDRLILVDIPRGGPSLQSRMTGVAAGVEDVLGRIPTRKILRVDGGNDRESARAVTATLLRRHRRLRTLLVSGTSDEMALGALDAICESGLSSNAAIVGHDGIEEVLPLIADPGSPMIGSVGFFAERYGVQIMDLVRRLVCGEQVPPAVYVSHELIDRRRACELLVRQKPPAGR